ncbi:MAG: hypothetical protein JSV12_02675 [Candidatus Bathyarchaeota archaeon]|nr:MAG: hypothetical protein JSV12_02675 [Candidatus Bathyarchaeota archaeon]
MRHTVKKGKTLLVNGPASVNILSGETTILGAKFRKGERAVIRDGKRLPFETNKRVVFDLMLGENASFEEVDGTTIPFSWKNAFKKVVSHGRPVTVMVMGGTDSGKTSFCVYLANRALKEGLKPAVIDGDLGQSDIGPPSTIGFSRVTKQIKDLVEMTAESVCFVGMTSPSSAVNKVGEELAMMKSGVLQTDVDFLIVNTDGWVEGEEAVGYKVQLAERVVPDAVVGIQQTNELTSILTLLKEKRRVIAIESPQVVWKRNKEKRKSLREFGYKKYLKEAKVRLFPLSQIKVEDALSETGGHLTVEHMERMEEGLLVALQNADRSFLGIGVFCGVDSRRETIRIYTTVGENVSTVCIGQVKLNREGKEIV